MANIVFRVILKISYYQTWFEFDNPLDASKFAFDALSHMVSTEDQKKETSITIKIVDVDAEKKAAEEEEEE